jgi:peptide/nickel transport system permease protein
MKKFWSFIKSMFKKKPVGALGLCILVLLVLVAIFADVLAPYPMVSGAMQVNMLDKLQKPYLFMSAAERQANRAAGDNIYWLGTDTLGRDLLSYMIYGARTSVILGVSCTVLSTLISVFIGTLSATIGGKFDMVVQRFVDAWQCIPSMLILLMMMSIMGNGIPQLIFALSVPNGIGGSRMIRSAAFSVKDSGYVKASELLGCGTWWKVLKHVIPNTMPLIIISAAGGIGGVVMMEASLNFLGYGVDPGTPSWGYLITNQGRSNMYVAPWLALVPGFAIGLMVFGANMFGDAVRDLMDPRLKGGVGSYNTKKIQKIAAKMQKKMAKQAARKEKVSA